MVAAMTLSIPRIIGHRGARAYAPENTLAGIREGARQGARWVEVDVKLTGDLQPVLMHDDDLDRTTDGTGAVAVTGTIGFIGLIAPHLMRPLVGYDPARLLVPSALAGAALLLAADIAVRIIPSTSDIKVGVLTSLIGVPFFLYLIMRERRALGGGVG